MKNQFKKKNEFVYRKNKQILSSLKEEIIRYPDIVRFEHVSKKFGDKLVLDDINFSIEDLPNVGELITIIGPSGCGKSTLIRCIAGLEPHFPPTTGSVYINNKKVVGPSRNVGLVDQSYSLLPNLTILQNIGFGLMLEGVDRTIVDGLSREWCNRVGLSGKENNFPEELSGGQKQRAAIAATLILKPRVILMDEPFGALDTGIRNEMQKLLVELWNKEESTIFCITHSVSEAIYLGDRIFCMDNGRIEEIIYVPRPDESPEIMKKHKWFKNMREEIENKFLKTK